MKIVVTETDIKYGYPENAEQCPIARAIRRVVGSKPVSVGHSTASISRQLFLLPMEARNFVVDFDDGAKVKPFSFELVP